MIRLILLYLVLFQFMLVDAQIDGNLPYRISLDLVASGFSNPTDIANAGDERLFIVERRGRIRILNQDGSINPTPFLDIDARVVNTGGQSEQGLLSLEFHHSFESTGWFFVHYTDNSGNTVVSRFSIDPSDPNIALPDSEKIIFTLDQPFTNHNGGSIRFGLDDMLYIGMGDGGSANDPNNFSQNGNVLLGKILRIDVDNGDPFSIPADNPFVNNPDVRDEIWAIGVRNPWKFSFDQTTGDLWMADVGQREWEEVNFQSGSSPGGENYGWRCREGNNDFNISGCDGITFTPAAAEYNHEGLTHCSITGGFLYRGSEDLFAGAPPIYVYTDYCSGTFWGAYQNENSEIASDEMNRVSGNAISSFGEDNRGELYVAALNNGRIFRLNAECNIDFELETVDASCDVSTDGAINVPVELRSFYDIEIINSITGEAIADSDAVPAGTYMVTVTRFGCSREYAETVTASVQPLEIEFSTANNTNVLSTNTEGESYQWFLNGEIIEGATGPSLILLETGIYELQITFVNGCVSSSGDIEIDELVLSTNTIEKLTSMKVLPIPSNDFLTLVLSTENFEQFDLRVTDISGKVQHTQAIEVQGLSEFKLDIQDYPSGIYLLTIEDGLASQTVRFVKQ